MAGLLPSWLFKCEAPHSIYCNFTKLKQTNFEGDSVKQPKIEFDNL